MLKWIVLSLPAKIIATILLLFLFWQAYVFLRPRPEDISSSALTLLTPAAEDAAKNIRLIYAERTQPARIGLAHLKGDPYGTVTTLLGIALDTQPELTWERTSIVKRFVADVSSAVWNASSLEELAASGRKVQLEGLISGKVIINDDDALPALELRVFNLLPGGNCRTLYFPGRIRTPEETKLIPEVFSRTLAKGWLILSILAILILPWLTPFLTVWALNQKSNTASALLLTAYVAADLILISLLPGAATLMADHLFWMALFAALCAGYSHWVCESIAARNR